MKQILSGTNLSSSLRVLALTAIMLICLKPTFAQGTWVQKADFGGISRDYAVAFSIGNKGYLGTGDAIYNGLKNDFWQYDPATDTWTQKADFGGNGRYGAVGFSIGSKGYIGTGYDNATYKNDFWEYDPSTNAWTKKADVGGGGRYVATGFSIGNKGYIGTGSPDGSAVMNDFWEYDPILDKWTQKANLGGDARYLAIGFSIGSKGYIGTGSPGGFDFMNDLWEYDPAIDSWTQKADFAGGGKANATGISIGNKGYIGFGLTPSGYTTNDFWEYDPAVDSWTQKANSGATPRWGAKGFGIGNKGYIGTGVSGGHVQKDFWEYIIPKKIYVKADASGLNDGSSWTNAFTKMQDALSNASTNDTIWVAKGTYYPDEGIGFTNGDRNASFIMKNNLSIYGGFAGTETQLSQRDWKTNVTILSGDLSQNDGAHFSNNNENSFHVIVNYNNGLNNTAVLDGFTVTAGNANSTNIGTYGAGMYNNNVSPKIINCIFSGNSASAYGGGIYNEGGSAFISNCNFLSNFSSQGGGIYNSAASDTIINCKFTDNQGSGMVTSGPDKIIGCSFSVNTGNFGGAIYNNGSATIVNCSFYANSATYGGGIFNFYSSSAISNCSFAINVASNAGGAMYNQSSGVTVNNSIFWYDREGEIASNDEDNSSVFYSIVQGGYNGEGNVDKDPLFADAVNADLHLQACSPAIDAGNNTAIPNGITTDLDDSARTVHNTVDIGAYEYKGTLYTFYLDKDNDGYGSGGDTTSFCATIPSGYADNNNDCNDNNAAINPGATEICGNGIDDNCNGEIDEDCGGGCSNATNLNTTNITAQTAKLNWVSSADPQKWQIQYKAANSVNWISVKLSGTKRSLKTSSLAANQTYKWRIRARCSNSWTVYSDVTKFKTLSSLQLIASGQQSMQLMDATEEKTSKIKVYPNPTSGPFIVELHVDKNINEIAKLELVNELGQIVSVENADINHGILQKRVTISSSLSSGFYMIKITVQNKTYIGKIIYQR